MTLNQLIANHSSLEINISNFDVLINEYFKKINNLSTKAMFNKHHLFEKLHPLHKKWSILNNSAKNNFADNACFSIHKKIFTRVSEKTMENAERIGRHARPGIEPGISRLPVFRAEQLGGFSRKKKILSGILVSECLEI